MTIKPAFAFLVPVVLLSACPTESVPFCESKPNDPACLALDAGADAQTDGQADAGPCGGCSGDTPVCDEATNRCVGCLQDTQCTDPAAPRCNTESNTCSPCMDDDQCARFSDTPVCETGTGVCVECTEATQEAACPPIENDRPAVNRVCNVETFECEGTLGFCQRCVSDEECLSNDQVGTFRCIPLEFDGMPRDNYCMLDLESHRAALDDPSANCPPQQFAQRMRTSLGGVEALYCVVREANTTCEAVLSFGSVCAEDTVAEDCGASGLDDGVCRQMGRGFACTYECAGPSDCPDGVACDNAPRTCNPF